MGTSLSFGYFLERLLNDHVIRSVILSAKKQIKIQYSSFIIQRCGI